MEKNNIDEINRSIRTRDKLDYRLVLQRKVEFAVDCIGTDKLPGAVLRLRKSMFFETSGLPFKSDIARKEKELRIIWIKKIIRFKVLHPNAYGHPYKNIMETVDYEMEYYEDLLEYLIDLLAKHDALIMSKDYTESGEMGDAISI